MQTPELIRKGQDIDIFSVLSGFLTSGDRSPQVQAIAAQGLASLFDRTVRTTMANLSHGGSGRPTFCGQNHARLSACMTCHLQMSMGLRRHLHAWVHLTGAESKHPFQHL